MLGWYVGFSSSLSHILALFLSKNTYVFSLFSFRYVCSRLCNLMQQSVASPFARIESVH